MTVFQLQTFRNLHLQNRKLRGKEFLDSMTRASNYGLYDPSDYERSTFVIINDFDDCEDNSWKCPKCGCQIYVENTDAIDGAQRRHDHLLHCRNVQGSEAPSSNDKTGQQFSLAQDKFRLILS
jgi:hypothetical protein